MGAFSEYMYEQGYQIGKAEVDGTLTTTQLHVKKIMDKKHVGAEEAMEMLDVDKDFRPIILEELQKEAQQE